MAKCHSLEDRPSTAHLTNHVTYIMAVIDDTDDVSGGKGNSYCFFLVEAGYLLVVARFITAVNTV